MKMLKPKASADVDFKYVYYAMLGIRFLPQDHARHWISQYSGFRVALPPIEVQREVVRVLDLFTELESELKRELAARRMQYEHYRDQILSFADRSA
jgi:type I restriction enzyme S subunit